MLSIVKSRQVKLPLIKTSDNCTSITCRNGNKIAKTSNLKFKNICNIKMSHLEAANKYITVRLENVSTKRQLDE